MNIKIRKAKESDLVTIVDFQLAMALETENLLLDKSIVEKGVLAAFNDSAKGQYFITEIDGAIAASLMITFEWSDWRNGMVYWIQSVYVKENFRRLGIYRKMYTHIQDLVNKAENVRGIRLYVDKTNIRAQKTYENTGMNGEHYQLFEWMK
ncbi:MAG: GNAT family N-acetyltransferase [Bacteroidales bacterium]|jgi:ribosomal protein S18 acetylase RimI-like enzyme|nr:GNAT family N-acetyltransferase [Bacteroidales bacterium]